MERQASSGDVDTQLWLTRHLAATGEGGTAENRLRKAAIAGNADAMMALGKLLLSRTPPVPPSIIEEGRKLIIDAAHKGHGEAAHLVSLITAIDPTLERNWTYALAYLGRAAKSRHRASQMELAFLAGDDSALSAIKAGRNLSPDIWQELHDRVDIGAWTSATDVTPVWDDPAIGIIEGFLPARVCDWIVRRARPTLEPAKTYNPQNGSGSVDSNRTNLEMRFAFPELDLPIIITLHRICRACGIPIQGMEPTSVLHYAVGQEYRPHYDFLDPRIASFKTEMAAIGQRHTTFLVVLNEHFVGGETDFPLIPYRFKGRKGDALMFRNVHRDGQPNRKTLHAGLPPTSGEKWLLSQWIRGKMIPENWGTA